jgi:NitT/TauT family transport system substrate-binding protein
VIGLEHVRVALPFDSLHYTPHYLALSLGCFEREGVEVEQTIPAHGVARALLTGDADVGLSGPMRALGTIDRGEGQLVCLAEVASRAAFFLLGRTPAPDFAWRDLSGRRVLAFAEAAMSRLCLEYLLDRHGVRPGAVEVVSDVPTATAVERFLTGRADYLLQGQPLAERLLAGGRAHLAAALGPALGPLAFSAYLATPRGLAERAPAVDGVLRALTRALRWLHGHPPEESADRVAAIFPGEERPVLVAGLRRLLGGRTWPAEPILRRPGFDALVEILLLRGFIKRSYLYDALVDTSRAEAAVRVVGRESA